MGMTHSMAYIKYDSKLLDSMPGAKLDLGGETREPVIGDNKILGYATKIKPSTLECEVALTQGTKLADLAGITNATLTYEADTGQTYSIRNAFLTEPPQVSAGDGGKVSLKFAGDPAQEMGV